MMNRMVRIMAMLLTAMLLGGCGAGPGHGSAEAGEVGLFAVNVGKGDALILKVGDWTGLIDVGKARAMGRVKAALKSMGIAKLDAVFLTHTDDDHAGGLEWLAAWDMPVDSWYASAMYTGIKARKHPMVLAASLRDQAVQWLQRGDTQTLGDSGATLRVLAPTSRFEDEDDNSLVMMLESDQGRILLTGDMELPEEAELMSFGDDLSCAVLKVANHADDDTTGEAFARVTAAQVAVVSTDSREKPGTPDPEVVGRLEAVGSRVVVTQDAGLGLRVTLKGGVAEAQAVDIDAEPVSGVYVADVDADDDRVTLGNSGSEAVDLGGYYLYSDKGDELFAFPEGTAIAPGGKIIIGTNSTDGSFDLLWDDKKVINKKKSDVIFLYDDYGRIVDSRDNGR